MILGVSIFWIWQLVYLIRLAHNNILLLTGLKQKFKSQYCKIPTTSILCSLYPNQNHPKRCFLNQKTALKLQNQTQCLAFHCSCYVFLGKPRRGLGFVRMVVVALRFWGVTLSSPPEGSAPDKTMTTTNRAQVIGLKFTGDGICVHPDSMANRLGPMCRGLVWMVR